MFAFWTTLKSTVSELRLTGGSGSFHLQVFLGDSVSFERDPDRSVRLQLKNSIFIVRNLSWTQLWTCKFLDELEILGLY